MAGILFTETMKGFFSASVKDDDYLRGESTGKSDASPFEFTLTVASDDVQKMVSDSQHPAKMTGTEIAPTLSMDRMTVSDGVFNLFVVDPTRVDRKSTRLNSSHLG